MVTRTGRIAMRTITLADAKARLSAVIDQVEAGEEVVITRRGKAVARIVAESGRLQTDPRRVLAAQRKFLAAQSPQDESSIAVVRKMRESERY